MPGKRRVTSELAATRTARILLRLPEALKSHLEDQAYVNRHSLNEEIVERLMRPTYKKYSRETWQALMALEPKSDDTRTSREIAIQIAMVQGEDLPPEHPEDNFEDIGIEWLPGSVEPLWNNINGEQPKK